MSDTMKNKPEDLKTDAENQATELDDSALDGVVGGGSTLTAEPVNSGGSGMTTLEGLREQVMTVEVNAVEIV